MKFWLAIILGCAVLQAGPAAAGPWRDLRAAQSQPDRADRAPQRQRDGDRPDRPDRYERQERPQRLSDEERRGLHRDLDKARREIYRPPQR